MIYIDTPINKYCIGYELSIRKHMLFSVGGEIREQDAEILVSGAS